MNASEWRYVGEGAEHAIFSSFLSCDEISEESNERLDVSLPLENSTLLLRIRKRDLVASSVWKDDFERQTTTRNLQRDDRSLYYIQHVISPSITPYIDIPKVIPLNWSFLKELHHRTVEGGCILPARRTDWEASQSTMAKKDDASSSFEKEPHPFAKVLYDYRSLNHLWKNAALQRNVGILVPNRCISIEIKPKAGYVAFSPLVHPLHRVKYQKSRFVLLQELHQQGNINKGWTKVSAPIKMSYYNPVDLYSKDASRMQKAISSLFSSPQNNLKVHYNGRPLIGHSIHSVASENYCKTMLFNLRPQYDSSEKSIKQVESILGEWIVKILQHETILQQLLKLQELDILDADGAILTYDRLVELCAGSHEEAQSILDDCTLSKETCDQNQLLKSSPFSLFENDRMDNDDEVIIESICDSISAFRALLMSSDPEAPTSNQMNEFHMQVATKVKSLNIEGCCFLLQNWLLSLAMSDASIFITLQQIEPTETGNISAGKGIVPIASNKDPGLLSFSADDKTTYLAYTVRLIDYDGKPASKLQSRHEKESPFCALSDKNTLKLNK
jgi:inositol-pentakisphosphate 2-kinase